MIILELREFFLTKTIPLFRPTEIKEDAKSFISMYGGYMNDVAIMAKDSKGFAYYPSKTAPVYEKRLDFLEQFVTLASEIGVNVSVAMNLFIDEYFANDPKYKTYNENGDAAPHAVCPNRVELIDYAKEIAGELLKYPISEIILFGAGYVRDDYCLCKTCKKEFAKAISADSDISWDLISSDSNYMSAWEEFRTSKINTAIQEIQSVITASGKDVKLTVEIPIDPETGLADGLTRTYGLDINAIRNITKSILINVYPWTPALPPEGTKEFDELVSSLYFTKEFIRRGGSVSLYRWGASDEDTISQLRAIAKAAELDRVMISFTLPENYRERRESSLFVL